MKQDLSISEVADLLGVSPSQARRYIGKLLPGVQLAEGAHIRVPRAAVMELLDRAKRPTVTMDVASGVAMTAKGGR
jgi:excisionase family DNA binding protein